MMPALYLRTIQPLIEKNLFKQKIIVIYGARQVGKTTLVKTILNNLTDNSLYLNCDEPDIRQRLTDRTSTELHAFVGNKKIVVIDEAQRVKNIGITLKLLNDNYPQIQILATGSSSFNLSNRIAEPLTGRKIEFFLYPLSLEELLTHETELENHRLLKDRMILGSYPAVISSADSRMTIEEISESYLYRDITEYQVIRNKDLLRRLLQALALQIGSEVSFNEVGALLGVDKLTVERYMNLLEQAYIIFQLRPFNRNQRKELGKKRKIYFFDLGVRNAIINNLNPLDLRQDVGMLWENFVISERIKWLNNHHITANAYFWRNYEGQEIDYLEEKGGQLSGFECRWREKKWSPPRAFLQNYPHTELHLINQESYIDYLTK
jgi:predicted AAA+ superfamily ATPase